MTRGVAVALLFIGCSDDNGGAGGVDTAEPVHSDTIDIEEQDTGPVPGWGGVPWCAEPVVPPEALRRPSQQEDDLLMVDGRSLSPAGTQAVVSGFPIDMELHPTLPRLFVANNGRALRALQMLDTDTGALLQTVNRDRAFYGLGVAPDGSAVFASGGRTGRLERYSFDAEGLLFESGSVEVDDYPAGMVFDASGETLWVAQFRGDQLVAVDPESLEITGAIVLPFGPYEVVRPGGGDVVFLTGFDDTRIAAVSLDRGVVLEEWDFGGSPLGIVATADGSRVYATVCDGDIVVGIDTDSLEVVASVAVADDGLVAPKGEGAWLPGSAPGGLALHDESGRLYVTRSSDNAVSIYTLPDLQELGALPTAWYPTTLALNSAGDTLFVANGKGLGAGPTTNDGSGPKEAKEATQGTIQRVELTEVDLVASTEAVAAHLRRPRDVFEFTCDGTFPLPPERGLPTPIEHVVLIVRENKTYDSVLGDLQTADGDPSLLMWDETVTPNLHALAREFTVHDNYYNESQASDQGHLWLTASFVTGFMERIWLEGGDDFQTAPVSEAGQPDSGTFFMHLIRHATDFWNFGEVVGTGGQVDGVSVVEFTDLEFPGLFYNQEVKDQEKAEHVVSRLLDDGEFPPFSYVLLPNDHTYGLSPGKPTPASMISDNDYATGLIVDAISHSEYWDKTAIFITQDDTQSGRDHVDGQRSVLVVVSPWAKRAHTSSVRTSFPSLFRSFELLLDLPPMNRYDATGTPLWDAFTTAMDDTPYEVRPRQIEDGVNPAPMNAAGVWSEEMDFSGPDRNGDLGDVLWWHVFGRAPRGSRLARAMAGEAVGGPEPDLDDAEDVEEMAAYDAAWSHFAAWLNRHPEAKRGVSRRAERYPLPSALRSRLDAPGRVPPLHP